LDQAGIVRGFVKWDYELRLNDNIHHVVQRAFQIANTEPHGPVYLVLPREVLLEKIDKVSLLPIERYGPSAVPEANTSALDEAARLLVGAENPLAITSYLGRHPQSVAPLVELAESLGMRVVSQGMRMNFPTNHPLSAGASPNPYLKEADVILIIDHQIPYLPTKVKPLP
jgi:acetolactate synthase-1/2/3 large subunit